MLSRVNAVPKRRGASAAAVVMLGLALAGCVRLGPRPPASLLTLTPASVAASGRDAAGAASSAITLSEFDAPARLDVLRVPVQITDSQVAYVADVAWVERPARLFRRLIAETLRSRSNRLVVDGDDPGVVSSQRLTGVLREFGYDARTSSVVVRFDAVRSTAGGAVSTRRFEAVVPGIPPEGAAIGDALNRAANQVADEVAAWFL
ncbi:ABC transporter [Erythrobacteraceae bacterium CFH 75059]|uniref:ABC-type transport auxiliary lipoprotein family protein n=1 Tax=Qipengyuania thermophila TaxID=2509361 RepID=UPI0010215A78|nr:ABC-type transport auxiliary lipoprotein family protein [Qipengyuania thermophila]TCD02099.1 ABC transporter [Erythrobacteraceae bacterium CFH 75059]